MTDGPTTDTKIVDVEFIHDLFQPFGGVSVRRMFRGAGLFADGVMFGLVSGGQIYLKADATTVTCFEREQCEPFEYLTKNGKRTLTSYWRLPDRLYDDADELAQWAAQALAAARRGATVKPKAGKKRIRRSAEAWATWVAAPRAPAESRLIVDNSVSPFNSQTHHNIFIRYWHKQTFQLHPRMSPIEGKADQFSLLCNPDRMEKNQMFLVLLRFSDNKGRASQFMEGHKEWIKHGLMTAYFCWSVVFSLIWAVAYGA